MEEVLDEYGVKSPSELKVKDLQQELQKRGLDKTGLKSSLCLRLEEALKKESTGSHQKAGSDASVDTAGLASACQQESTEGFAVSSCLGIGGDTAQPVVSGLSDMASSSMGPEAFREGSTLSSSKEECNQCGHGVIADTPAEGPPPLATPEAPLESTCSLDSFPELPSSTQSSLPAESDLVCDQAASLSSAGSTTLDQGSQSVSVHKLSPSSTGVTRVAQKVPASMEPRGSTPKRATPGVPLGGVPAGSGASPAPRPMQSCGLRTTVRAPVPRHAGPGVQTARKPGPKAPTLRASAKLDSDTVSVSEDAPVFSSESEDLACNTPSEVITHEVESGQGSTRPAHPAIAEQHGEKNSIINKVTTDEGSKQRLTSCTEAASSVPSASSASPDASAKLTSSPLRQARKSTAAVRPSIVLSQSVSGTVQSSGSWGGSISGSGDLPKDFPAPTVRSELSSPEVPPLLHPEEPSSLDSAGRDPPRINPQPCTGQDTSSLKAVAVPVSPIRNVKARVRPPSATLSDTKATPGSKPKDSLVVGSNAPAAVVRGSSAGKGRGAMMASGRGTQSSSTRPGKLSAQGGAVTAGVSPALGGTVGRPPTVSPAGGGTVRGRGGPVRTSVPFPSLEGGQKLPVALDQSTDLSVAGSANTAAGTTSGDLSVVRSSESDNRAPPMQTGVSTSKEGQSPSMPVFTSKGMAGDALLSPGIVSAHVEDHGMAPEEDAGVSESAATKMGSRGVPPPQIGASSTQNDTAGTCGDSNQSSSEFDHGAGDDFPIEDVSDFEDIDTFNTADRQPSIGASVGAAADSEGSPSAQLTPSTEATVSTPSVSSKDKGSDVSASGRKVDSSAKQKQASSCQESRGSSKRQHRSPSPTRSSRASSTSSSESQSRSSHSRTTGSREQTAAVREKDNSARSDPAAAVLVAHANSDHCVWISGLPNSSRAWDLKVAAEPYGKVANTKILTSVKAPGSSCFGLITMSTVEEAARCISGLDGSKLLGHTISAVKARSDVPFMKAVVKSREASPSGGQKTSENRDSSRVGSRVSDTRHRDRESVRNPSHRTDPSRSHSNPYHRDHYEPGQSSRSSDRARTDRWCSSGNKSSNVPSSVESREGTIQTKLYESKEDRAREERGSRSERPYPPSRDHLDPLRYGRDDYRASREFPRSRDTFDQYHGEDRDMVRGEEHWSRVDYKPVHYDRGIRRTDRYSPPADRMPRGGGTVEDFKSGPRGDGGRFDVDAEFSKSVLPKHEEYKTYAPPFDREMSTYIPAGPRQDEGRNSYYRNEAFPAVSQGIKSNPYGGGHSDEGSSYKRPGSFQEDDPSSKRFASEFGHASYRTPTDVAGFGQRDYTRQMYRDQDHYPPRPSGGPTVPNLGTGPREESSQDSASGPTSSKMALGQLLQKVGLGNIYDMIQQKGLGRTDPAGVSTRQTVALESAHAGRVDPRLSTAGDYYSRQSIRSEGDHIPSTGNSAPNHGPGAHNKGLGSARAGHHHQQPSYEDRPPTAAAVGGHQVAGSTSLSQRASDLLRQISTFLPASSQPPASRPVYEDPRAVAPTNPDLTPHSVRPAFSYGPPAYDGHHRTR